MFSLFCRNKIENQASRNEAHIQQSTSHGTSKERILSTSKNYPSSSHSTPAADINSCHATGEDNEGNVSIEDTKPAHSSRKSENPRKKATAEISLTDNDHPPPPKKAKVCKKKNWKEEKD